MRLDKATHTSDCFLAGIKAACALLGLCDEYLSEPFEMLTPSQRLIVRDALEVEGILN